jgi:protein-S-isoprenylcysteine O-methyltransferase Ste14
MYQDELARAGKRLFFIRGTYIYAIVAISTLIAWCSSDIGPFAGARADCVWFWASVGVASAGALIRIVTSGHAALGTSGRTKARAEAAELNTTGPYSLVRNPLYVGRIVNYTGLAMLSGSWVFAALAFLLSVLIYERISVYEEEFLRQKFGAAHSDWARNVPALLPRLHGWVKPKYGFWWKRMIWREKQKLFLLGTAVFLTWFARLDFSIRAVPAEQWGWAYAYGALVLAFAVSEAMRIGGYFKELS